MINYGPLCQCVKTGVYFTLSNDDRVFTGDLFYDLSKQEFQIRGIPSWNGAMTHCLPKLEQGPMSLMMLVTPDVIEGRPGNPKFTDLTFKKAKCTTVLAVHIEEWYEMPSMMKAIEEHWEIVPNLVWTKG